MNPALRPPAAAMLPHVLPASPYARLLLFAMRRMAAGGIDDAQAAHALFAGFGIHFRRPLVLLRAMMAEIARVASTQLVVAPCCCARMTDDEARLLAAVAGSLDAPRGAARMLGTLLHVHCSLGVLCSAQAVASSFADLGMPLSVDED